MRSRVAAARGWPTWLAALALALHLLAPGLCLAQRLSSAPLGALCSAAPGRDAQWPSPDGGAAAHLLDHCEHCVPGSALLADTAPHRAQPPAATAAAQPHASAAPAPTALHWRPPPRAPPASA